MTLTLPGVDTAPRDADKLKAWSQYDTPALIARALVSMVPVRERTILEPSAGIGNVVHELFEAGARRVVAVEIDPDRCHKLSQRFRGMPINIYDRFFAKISASS